MKIPHYAKKNASLFCIFMCAKKYASFFLKPPYAKVNQNWPRPTIVVRTIKKNPTR